MDLTSVLLIGGAGLALLLAVGQTLRPGRDRGRLIFTGLLICLAVWCLYAALLYSGLLNKYPVLTLTHLPFTYCVGPFCYLYFSYLIGGYGGVNRKSLFHIIPAVLVLLWMSPVYLSSAEYKHCLYENVVAGLIHRPCQSTHSPLIDLYERLTLWWIVGNKIAILIYMIGLFKTIIPLRRHETEGIPRIRILTLSLAIYTFSIVIIALIGSFFPQPFLVRLSIMMVAFWIFLVYFAGQRFPEYLADAHLRETHTDGLVQGLTGAEVERTANDLKELMQEERVFLGEDLKLNNLALMLDIRPWQLSEILNTRFKKNFNQYINEYRINEACKILRAEPDKNILEVAFEVGFSNKNTFNRAFREDTGMTPSEFRKQNQD